MFTFIRFQKNLLDTVVAVLLNTDDFVRDEKPLIKTTHIITRWVFVSRGLDRIGDVTQNGSNPQ